VSVLDRKLWRDLTRMKAQVATIALVVACGVASWVTMRSAYDSLLASRDAYYDRYSFGDVFVKVNRAPLAVAARVATVVGVSVFETRIVKEITLDVPGTAEPVRVQAVSLAPESLRRLNLTYLRSGRVPDPERGAEVLVNEAFAKAHHLEPGSVLPAVINGHHSDLRVTGVALSPEYVYIAEPGSFVPDDKRYGVVWMNERALASAFQMEGSFNDVVIRLERGASEPQVIATLDRLLEPYGTTGAYGRTKHPSARWVADEIRQLDGQAKVIPSIFLAVAAVLVNVVLARLLGLQREQIAALKALGYSNARIGLHYLEYGLVITVLGALLGTGLGAWGGSAMMNLYKDYFRFPVLAFQPEIGTLVTGALISIGAGLLGGLGSVRSAVRVPPAEAMRPAAPPVYHRTVFERVGVYRLLPNSARMVLRDIERRPWRALLSSLGIAMAVAVLVVGRYSFDAIDYLVTLQFERAQTDDLTVAFFKEAPLRARHTIAHLPGVIYTEPVRIVGVRFRHGARVREAAIEAVDPRATLRRVFDSHGAQLMIPSEGLALGRGLARVLDLRVGETVRVEDPTGERPTRDLAVVALVDDMVGASGYMHPGALARCRGDDGRISAVAVRLDPRRYEAFQAELKRIPNVGGVTRRAQAIWYFRHETARMMTFFTFVLATFGALIAVAVVYNNARIALETRARDLASLRVLGMTRAEVSAILLGEQASHLVLGVPIGLWLGRVMAIGVSQTVDPELFRMPLIIESRTYAFAVTVVLVSGLVSGLLVRRRVDALDLVAVLKSRD
jgi:putative ABC transport system permease protein